MSSSAYATEQILRILVPIGGPGGLLAGHPDHRRHPGRAGRGHHLLPRRGQVLPEGRRLLRGEPGQLRPQRGPDRRRRPAHQLHDHRGRVGGGRRRRHHLGRPRPRATPPCRCRSPSSSSSPTATCAASERPAGSSPSRPTSSSPTWPSSSSSGLVQEIAGQLRPRPRPATAPCRSGHASGGLLLGVSVFYLLRAFANGGSAMTGTEAISNGVSIFREPQASNARTTLVLMSTILGAMFLGVSVLAALTHALPFVSGTPDRRLRDRQAGLRHERRRARSSTTCCRRRPRSS